MIQLSELLFLGLRGNAGSGTVCADFVNKSVLAVIIGVLLFPRPLRPQRVRAQTGQRMERRSLLVIVDSGDLCINDIADGQDILGLADTAVGDLGNVDQTVNTGENLCRMRRKA